MSQFQRLDLFGIHLLRAYRLVLGVVNSSCFNLVKLTKVLTRVMCFGQEEVWGQKQLDLVDQSGLEFSSACFCLEVLGEC